MSGLDVGSLPGGRGGRVDADAAVVSSRQGALPLAEAAYVGLRRRRGVLWLEVDRSARPGRRPDVRLPLVARDRRDDVHAQSADVLESLLTALRATPAAGRDEVARRLREQVDHVRAGGRASWSPLATDLPEGSGRSRIGRVLEAIGSLP